MKLSGAVQESLLALLCYDEKAGSIVASLLPASSFDPVYKEVAAEAITYWQRFKQPPGSHTLEIFEAACGSDSDRGELFKRLYDSVTVTAEEVNSKYILDQANVFARYQRLKSGMGKAIKALDMDDEAGVMEAEAALAETLKAQATVFDPGIDFINDVDASVRFFDHQDEALPTGCPDLDSRNLGPAPGRLHLYVAPAKSGKSWWLLNLATRGFQYGKKVLYITLELTAEEACLRLTQSIFSMSKRAAKGLQYHRFNRPIDKSAWGTDFTIQHIDGVDNFEDPDAETNVRKKMKVFQGSERLIVKEFPPKTLACGDLDAYLDLLEHHENFVPDLILIDYADDMKINDKVQRWEALIDVMQHLKRVAMERNVAVATASQTQRAGANATRVDAHHTAGAWDKVAKADTVFTYSQTEEERKDGLARIFVAAARSDADRFEVLLSQNYEIGQYVLSSVELGSDYNAPSEEPVD